jgi:D-alanine-D-alanine ligase
MLRVGVLRGGISPEHEVSLKSGSAVLRALHGELAHKYKPLDILITRDGQWFLRGLPLDPKLLHKKVDVIVNGLHGYFGEDGKVQKILDDMQIPYTGSGALASAIAMHKGLAKERFKEIGVKTAQGIEVAYKDEYGEEHAKNITRQIWEKMGPPWIVKPITGGSSVGTHLCKTFDELRSALEENFQNKNSVLIEEFIDGREATVGVVNGYRGEELYILPPIEIVKPTSRPFFDFDAKYSGESQEICPGNFTKEDKAELMRLARLIHEGLDLKHYSRSDFIIHPRRGIYALEVNTLPGLTEQSLLPKAIDSVGGTFHDFIDHLIQLAQKKHSL